MNKKNSSLTHWSFLMLYTLLIFFTSFLPGSYFRSVVFIPFGDKIVHFLLYTGLGFFALRAFLGKKAYRGLHYLFAVGYSILIGALVEFGQGFIPQRVPSLSDLVADTLGAFLGAKLYVKYLTSCQKT